MTFIILFYSVLIPVLLVFNWKIAENNRMMEMACKCNPCDCEEEKEVNNGWMGYNLW